MHIQKPLSPVVIPSADVLSAPFGDEENVLLDIANGIYFSLDGVGAFLWNIWRETGSVERSIDQLVGAYEVDRAVAEADVMALIDALVGRGLISLCYEERDSATA